MERERLLIIEDDEDIRTQLTYALQDEYDVSVAGDRTRAAAAVQEAPPEIVTLDLGLPPTPDTAEEGLRALEDILAVAPEAKVIIITGNGDRANAVAAVERGAFDYHLKPVNLDDLKVVLRRASYLRQLERESEEQARQREDSIRFTDILGSTPKMREIFGVIQRVAKTDATVLCEGESGTGKELVARAVHTHSPRKSGPFVAINCVAIPETLLESELFGRERGEDVVLLANAFLRRNAQVLKRKVRFSPEALEAIVKYQWPGNIRELENKVHRAVIMATSRIIGSADLDLNPSAVIDALPTLREARDQSERRLIVNALVRSRGNISRAARVLDISRPTFHDMLVKHSIDAKEFR